MHSPKAKTVAFWEPLKTAPWPCEVVRGVSASIAARKFATKTWRRERDKTVRFVHSSAARWALGSEGAEGKKKKQRKRNRKEEEEGIGVWILVDG